MILKVIVDLSTNAVDRTFDYLGEDVPIGSRVSVPFGKNQLIGFVVDKSETTTYDITKVKQAKYLDSPIDNDQLSLVRFMTERYNLRTIDVLRLLIPSKLRKEKAPQSTRIFLKPITSSLDEALSIIGTRSQKQIDAIKYIWERNGEFKTTIGELFGSATPDALVKKGVVEKDNVHERAIPLKSLSVKDKTVTLTDAQKDAINTILTQDGPFLIHGVTGSGKTEVYMNCIDKMLSENKGTIMLVPEISLTPQMLGLFRARFGDQVSILHSGLNESEIYDEWERLRKGESKIALGPRSAIFAPISNLGLIIIDEEHDGSYISESNPRYDTKEVATERAKLSKAKLVLGSATPNIDTYQKAKDGTYTLITMPDRVSKYKLQEIEIVDMLYEFRGGNRTPFSGRLLEEIRKTLDKNEQVMIFLNRRGFASYIRCPSCGWIAKCSDCDVSLSYHKEDRLLKCHYCGKQYKVPDKCPKCGNIYIKNGRVGTEQVVELLEKNFPDAKILRLDMDTKTSKDSYFKILEDFKNEKANILVGTQMIAKGHDFPNVTLVGILEGDAALFFSEYNASETTFQLITQVAGRAGRAEKQGKVIMQTYLPTHYVMKFAKNYDYEHFFDHEINVRHESMFPPFTKLIRILVSSYEEKDGTSTIKEIYKKIKALESTTGPYVYVGMNRSPYKRLQSQYRFQVIIRLLPEKFEEVRDEIYKIVNEYKTNKVSVFVELNPTDLR